MDLEIVALTNCDRLKSDCLDLIGGVSVDEPVPGFADTFGVELELVAVGEVASFGVLSEWLTLDATITNECEHIECHLPCSQLGKGVNVALKSWAAGHCQDATGHLPVVGRVEPELGSELAQRTGWFAFPFTDDLGDFKLFDRWE